MDATGRLAGGGHLDMNAQSAMRYGARVRRLLTVLILPSVLMFSGCAKQTVQAEQRMAAPVMVATVLMKDVPVQITGIGNVQAYSTVSVKSLVNGELDQVHFVEGQEVKKDSLLFTIDPRPFQADLQRAEANLARDTAQLRQAEANVARDEANAGNAEVEKRRYQVLVDKGVIAREQYDQVSANAEALAAAVRADQAAVENASESIAADRAAIETSKLNLQYCYIRSPIEGRTGSLLLHGGNVIKSNDTALVVINQVHPIYVDFSVPQGDLPAIRQFASSGKVRVAASIPNDSGPPVEGKLSFIDNAVNAATGTILLKGVFENGDGRLWPGQFVNVTITLTTQKNAVVVPSQAIQTGQSGQYVFTVKPDKTVELRPVAVARVIGEETVIEKGLQPGETVVTDGQIRLVPGALIQVKSAL